MDYNEIYKSFLDNSGYDYSDLPQIDELRYSLIRNAISLYNAKAKKYPEILGTKIIANDKNETINRELNDTQLLVLVYMMCYITARKIYTEYTALWDTVANETGVKDYNSNCKAKKSAMENFKSMIDDIIEDEIVDFDY